MITSKVEATLIPNKGSDLIVVNAARVSFRKEATEFSEKDEGLIRYLATHDHWTPFSHCRDTFAMFMTFDGFGQLLMWLSQEEITSMVWTYFDGKVVIKHSLYGWAKILNRITDEKFYADERARAIPFAQFSQVYSVLREKYPVSAKYLIKKSEYFESFGRVWRVPVPNAVFSNPYFIDITIRQKVPLFVARQDFKHMVGRTFNEVSRRYVDDAPDLFLPEVWREKAENKKQGSTDTASPYMHEQREFDQPYTSKTMAGAVAEWFTANTEFYEKLIANKVCPEQARILLPQGMMTEYYVTANLAAWNRMMKQRLDEHAQVEIRDLAIAVQKEVTKYLQAETFEEWN